VSAANARPDSDFKYFSKRTASLSVANSNDTTIDHGRCDTVWAWAVVMPFKPRGQIICDPDVVPRQIDTASQDVHETFGDSMHSAPDACVGPSEFAKEIAVALQRAREFFDVERLDSWQNLQLRVFVCRCAGQNQRARPSSVRLRRYTASSRQPPHVDLFAFG